MIVASPPCREFSLHDMPWSRGKVAPPDMTIVNACFRIREEAKPRLFLLENVRGAQPFLGKAIAHHGPFYFWGDAALLPWIPTIWKDHRHIKSPAERAKIPFPLAYAIAQIFISSRKRTDEKEVYA